MEQTPIVTETPETDDRQPLWKQILGAVIGGGLALCLYYGYDYAKPRVTAYLTLPTAEGGRLFDLGAANIADKTMDENRRKRILSRNVRASENLQNMAHDPEMLNTVDTHSLDIAWPGHNPEDPKYNEVMGIEDEPASATVAVEDTDEDEEMEADLLEEEMATKDMEMTEDEWENLWGDIRSREDDDDDAVASNADALPDTGFGIGFAAAGAIGGAIGIRRKKSRKHSAL